MIQCESCEFFRRGEGGAISFSCDPFTSIKEPECLTKWQLIKINQMVASYQSMLNYYHKLAPMQEKMFKVMERELDGLDEADKWKIDDDSDANDSDANDSDTNEWNLNDEFPDT